ncbi:glycosyltransferase [Synechococcus sp. Cruz CV-v-12]|nr:glycosyltransferase [Synechococcus sp. Cruz CV-v-12]
MDGHPDNIAINIIAASRQFLMTAYSRPTDALLWREHVAFAYWLVQTLSPTTFVQLGVRDDGSYTALCLAVKNAAGARTVCFGIDCCDVEGQTNAWSNTGWEHPSDSRARQLEGSSRLTCPSFDAALGSFEDGSIDLIHFNDTNSSLDLPHLFESWLPKLSSSSTVLICGINPLGTKCYHSSFWDSLCLRYPGRTFSFLHGHGLGVLFPAATLPEPGEQLCRLDQQGVDTLRKAFAAMGDALDNQNGQVPLKGHGDLLEAYSLEEMTIQTNQSFSVEQSSLRVDALRRELIQRNREIGRLEALAIRNKQQLAELQDKANDDQLQIIAEMSSVKESLTDVLQSRSWRLLSPVRTVLDRIKSKARLFHASIPNQLLESQQVPGASSSSMVPLTVSPELIAAEVAAIRQSGLFDEAFYCSILTDHQTATMDPIQHYCEVGWRQGRNPSTDFDTNFYLSTYTEIRDAGLNPFWHYVVAGASELRHPRPDMTPRYEDDVCFGKLDPDIKLFAFFCTPDWAQLRNRRPIPVQDSKQPLPCNDLKFYDPLDQEVLRRQSMLAKRHGLRGFCFSLDVLTDERDSQSPLNLFLTHGDIDFSFCVHITISASDCTAVLVRALGRAISDRRFLCINCRPVIVVGLQANEQAVDTLLGFRQQLSSHGIPAPFLIIRWTSFDCNHPLEISSGLLDALLDQPPEPVPGETGDFVPMDRSGVAVVPYSIVAFQGIARAAMAAESSQPTFHSVTVGRYYSVGHQGKPLVYSRFSIKDYRQWLNAAIACARKAHPEERRLVFLDAWNNWQEGLILEPDRIGGYGRLNETSRALLDIEQGKIFPKISVIVPNYNHQSYLVRRLDSIYNQTYQNLEVILLDDCSTDESHVVLDRYAHAYPEITRTIYNTTNSGGVFRQWAKGIKAATGDLVWIAESDDFCEDNFLEALVRCFLDETVLLACGQCVFVDQQEHPLQAGFAHHIKDLASAYRWDCSYVETAHKEVASALGIKNTIPNASAAVFRRPTVLKLLEEEEWLSMKVAGDWVFYLHLIRGGKIAYCHEALSYFRRYQGSAAEATYKKDVFYREVGFASRNVAALYAVPIDVLEQCRQGFKFLYDHHLHRSEEEFEQWYDYASVLSARQRRLPNVMVSTMGFFPGGAEILPIRLANEFKRQGLSVLLLNTGLNPREDGCRRLLLNEVPLVETYSIDDMKMIIDDFGIEALNSHQWHVQKYPLNVPDVFTQLRAHVASLHGMIEHGDAFGVTHQQLRKADQNVTTWVYTADKNLGPFAQLGVLGSSAARFIKLPNGIERPTVAPVSRVDLGFPGSAFVLCCVSRAIPDKGWSEAIRVVDRARVLTGCDIRLILVGNGPVYEEYCQAEIPEYVFLAGFSENSVGHYAASDMGIMLTKFKSESFPLTIVDCLFAGKPYISTDVGEIKNMLTLGEDVAGHVVSLDDWEVPIEVAAQAVARFVSDPEHYQRASCVVQDVVERFRLDVIAGKYVQIIQSDCDEHAAMEAS